ncbi:hypothetical protein [Streptomyces sp. NPDC057939]|uniref:hypothetical protein n=1 Tax=Streptomyces sp. NPDC057939 TaxID=3346284 RepID=UPI0036EB6298
MIGQVAEAGRRENMGFFGRGRRVAAEEQAKSGEVGTFRSPHSPEDTVRIVHAGLIDQLSHPSMEVTGPGLMESIHLIRCDSTGITVGAGNLVDTYFVFFVDLSVVSGTTEGHAYFDRPVRSVRRWMGNTLGIRNGVQMALEGAGVRIEHWDRGF